MLPKHRHSEAHRSRQVRLGCEVMEDRVLLSPGSPTTTSQPPLLSQGLLSTTLPARSGRSPKLRGGPPNAL